MIKFQFAELNRLAYDLSAAPDEVKEGVPDVMRDVVEKVEASAKTFAPVDTGALRESISSEVSEESGTVVGEIGPTVRYAMFVEWGTSKDAPQAFMGPALDRHSHELDEALGELGERAITKFGLTFG